MQHPPRALHLAGQGGTSRTGSHQGARARSCSSSRAPSPSSTRTSRSRSQSVTSTTGAVDFEWDYFEFHRHGDTGGQHPAATRAEDSLEIQPRKAQIPRRLPDARTSYPHSQLDKDDDEIQFLDANISLSPQPGIQSGSKSIKGMSHTDTHGLPQAGRPEEGEPPRPAAAGLVVPHQGEAVGPDHGQHDQPLLGQPDTPSGSASFQHKTLRFPPYYYGDDSPKMADLDLPRLPIHPHGHQVFPNYGLQEPPAPAKKKKRPSLVSSHVQETRPLSSRKTAKAATEKIAASSKKSTKKSTTKTSK